MFRDTILHCRRKTTNWLYVVLLGFSSYFSILSPGIQYATYMNMRVSSLVVYLQFSSQDSEGSMNREALKGESWKKGLAPQNGDVWSLHSQHGLLSYDTRSPTFCYWLLFNKIPKLSSLKSSPFITSLTSCWAGSWTSSKWLISTPWCLRSPPGNIQSGLLACVGSNTHVSSLLGAWASWKQGVWCPGWEPKKARQKPCRLWKSRSILTSSPHILLSKAAMGFNSARGGNAMLSSRVVSKLDKRACGVDYISAGAASLQISTFPIPQAFG